MLTLPALQEAGGLARQLAQRGHVTHPGLLDLWFQGLSQSLSTWLGTDILFLVLPFSVLLEGAPLGSDRLKNTFRLDPHKSMVSSQANLVN